MTKTQGEPRQDAQPSGNRAGDAARLSLHEPLLTTADAAALLCVRPSWIYEAVRAGRFPCIRVGRHIRFTRPLLEDWLTASAEMEQDTPPAARGRRSHRIAR